MKYSEFVESRLKAAIPTAVDMADVVVRAPEVARWHHVVLGLLGEWMEYQQATDAENTAEELGDFLFFLTAGGENARPKSWGVVTFQQYTNACKFIDAVLLELLDETKKAIVYVKASKPTEWKAERITRLWHEIGIVVAWESLTIEGLQESNTAKLTKRYASGYSNDAAQARADKVETPRTHSIVVYGPKGSGKTQHAEELRKFFGLSKIWDEGHEPPKSLPSACDTLILQTKKPMNSPMSKSISISAALKAAGIK